MQINITTIAIGIGIGWLIWRGSAAQAQTTTTTTRRAKKVTTKVTRKRDPKGLDPSLLYRPTNQTPADLNRLPANEQLRIYRENASFSTK